MMTEMALQLLGYLKNDMQMVGHYDVGEDAD